MQVQSQTGFSEPQFARTPVSPNPGVILNFYDSSIFSGAHPLFILFFATALSKMWWWIRNISSSVVELYNVFAVSTKTDLGVRDAVLLTCLIIHDKLIIFNYDEWRISLSDMKLYIIS